MNTRRIQSRLVSILLLFCMGISAGQTILASPPETVLPGGMAFGVKFACEGLIVVGFTEVETPEGSCMPAYDAGLRLNDRILSVNGKNVTTSEEFAAMIENSGSSTVEIRYERDGKETSTRLSPVYSEAEGKYKTGMWIRDTTAGIGTVTFILPDSGMFAGLGHGICDPNTGALLPMGRGTVLDVSISGVSKGISGRPGELKGCFTENQCGVLLGNTKAGVYGILNRIPYDKIPEKALPVAAREDLCPGEAYIWCTLEGDKVEKFAIEILPSAAEDDNGDSFEISVTDPDLIERTGGIVQGMSGSPIVKEGKLIGAVTHVLINDPTKGYGIFIENMLEAAG